MREKKFFRDCPQCNQQIGHTTAQSRGQSAKANKMCRECYRTNGPAKIRADAFLKMYGPKAVYTGSKGRKIGKWANAVKAKENYTCQICATEKTTPMSIHAHHVIPKEYFQDDAYNVSNGICLCAGCHQKLHLDIDTYVLNGVKFSATDFQNHLKGFLTHGKK